MQIYRISQLATPALILRVKVTSQDAYIREFFPGNSGMQLNNCDFMFCVTGHQLDQISLLLWLVFGSRISFRTMSIMKRSGLRGWRGAIFTRWQMSSSREREREGRRDGGEIFFFVECLTSWKWSVWGKKCGRSWWDEEKIVFGKWGKWKAMPDWLPACLADGAGRGWGGFVSWASSRKRVGIKVYFWKWVFRNLALERCACLAPASVTCS